MRTHLMSFLVVLATPLTAQEQKPIIGRVVDHAGKPVAAAEVTLVWTPAGTFDERDTEVLRVATDARGRFIAKVWPRIGYTVFATTAVGADGTFAASPVSEDVAVGRTCELQLSPPGRSRRVTLQGAAAWAPEPLSLQVASPGRSPIRLPLPADGVVPPMPGPAQVFVVDGSASVLFAASMPPDGDFEVALPPPVPVTLQVVGPDGTPRPRADVLLHGARRTLAGTETSAFQDLRRQGFWRRIVADGQGVVQTRVPEPDPARTGSSTLPLVLASADGVVATVTRPLTEALAEGTPPRIQLPAPSVLRLGRDDAFPVLAELVNALAARRSPVDKDGRLVVIASGSEFHDDVLSLWLPEGARAFVSAAAWTGVETLAVANLRRFRGVVAEQSVPLGGAAVAVVPAGDRGCRNQRLLWTSATGQLDLRLDDSAWVVLAAGERSFGWTEIPARGADAATATALTIQAEPLAVAELLCVDAAGGPVAGARVSGVVVAPVDRSLRGIATDPLLLDAFQRHVALRASDRRSDGRGVLKVLFPRLENLRVTVNVHAGIRSAATVELTVPAPIRVTLQ